MKYFGGPLRGRKKRGETLTKTVARKQKNECCLKEWLTEGGGACPEEKETTERLQLGRKKD